MKLTEITEAEFNLIPQSEKLFCDQIEYSHKFAFLTVKDDLKPILLCWQSDLLKPEIIDDERSSLLWFGIDQQIIVIRKFDGAIIFLAKLETPLLEIFTHESTFFLRTELEIYSFNSNGRLQSIYNLPEISVSINVVANIIKVNLIDGQIFDIPF